ncbi:hypothetical protein AWQ24_02210 [Picosynechococcus sp. PCC 8807]|nr:hypothetical protein AWQ24_02210 [Picosynechococcus sp. PCC 8807]
MAPKIILFPEAENSRPFPNDLEHKKTGAIAEIARSSPIILFENNFSCLESQWPSLFLGP